MEDRKRACRICLAKAGPIEVEAIESYFKTEEELSNHFESAHHIPIRRPGETYAQARRRFLLENPEAYDVKTCKCEQCEMRRSLDVH